MIESTCDARIAGNQQATNAINPRMSVTPSIVVRSVAPMPKSITDCTANCSCGNVNLGLRRGAQTDQMNVLDDTDNFARWRIARFGQPIWRDAFADRVLTRKELFSETF